MKKALYIGIYSDGSTSKMRGEKLRVLLPGWIFEVIDTDVPFSSQSHIWRSLGFRYKIGPVIKTVNEYIQGRLGHGYDLIWIDKGIYITKEMTAELRARAKKLVHYTPDTAFYGNRSRHFNESIDYYDYLVTTKSFELEDYRRFVAQSKVLWVTQGFDSDIHKPTVEFEKKENRVAFVGQCEKSREEVIQCLIDNNIRVVLAGFKWEKFVRKNKLNPMLDYRGQSVYNDSYTSLISGSYFSLGLLSKHFPELHTTRTFEIPACGTALITQRNEETSSFFSKEEAIFFTDQQGLVTAIGYYQKHLEELRHLTVHGTHKVNAGGFDYRSILEQTLRRVFLAG